MSELTRWFKTFQARRRRHERRERQRAKASRLMRRIAAMEEVGLYDESLPVYETLYALKRRMAA